MTMGAVGRSRLSTPRETDLGQSSPGHRDGMTLRRPLPRDPPDEPRQAHCVPSPCPSGGGCAAGKRHRAITREQAMAALADGIRACIHCRPDTELRVL
ncbi:DUF6233 domain-containing protein [Streptomyces sp. NPDC056227]|uniref:DUF6233 domain-containing protein n=1 Tax=Streptomyces sp. NPDC056227 TaxID=3345753 RepID=UPI0035DD7980